MNNLAERTKKARKEAGLSQAELAKAIGTGQSTIASIENGRNQGSGFLVDIARVLGVRPDWLASGREPMRDDGSRVIVATQDAPPEGYIRLEHLPYQPSMGRGRVQIADQVVQHLDVLESFVRQKVGTVSADRIKILTGVGTSMMPRIKDQDIVFVDIEHRWIDSPGYYVIDVGGLLLLKKAMILSTGVLILRSENIEEYPDEERHDLRKAAETITVCGKVLAWWTLMQG